MQLPRCVSTRCPRHEKFAVRSSTVNSTPNALFVSATDLPTKLLPELKVLARSLAGCQKRILHPCGVDCMAQTLASKKFNHKKLFLHTWRCWLPKLCASTLASASWLHQPCLAIDITEVVDFCFRVPENDSRTGRWCGRVALVD